MLQSGGNTPASSRPPGLERAARRTPAQLQPAIVPKRGTLNNPEWLAILIVILFIVAAVGGWTYAAVSQSLRDLRSTGLKTLLDTEVTALQVWIEEKIRDTERWAGDPAIRTHINALVRLADKKASRDELCSAPARRSLTQALQPFFSSEESVAFQAIDVHGRVIATSFVGYCGQFVAAKDFFAPVRRVFQGQTRFVRPYSESRRLSRVPDDVTIRPMIWIEAPVRNETGDVVAALGFGKYADEHFNSILSVSRPGESGEAYAFDESGLMLSESRFSARLKDIPGQGGRMLEQQLRDPGGDLLAGHRASGAATEQPLTALADAAIASRGATDAAKHSGVLVEPYRNYRGASVIGAWRWLPEYDMGIAIEIDALEAYAPLHYLERAVGIFIWILVIATGAAFLSSWWVIKLRAREARRLGHYRLEHQIGEGGISHVYLARHTHLKRPTAVKVLKGHLATDEMVARFEREVQLCSQLTHPNTIEIYDYGRTRDGEFYYAMEYLHGITLADLVGRFGALPTARVIHIMRQACAALKEAHDKGWVHRDIKPQNIMLCLLGGQHDVVKVLDFGLVKEINRDQTRNLTQYSRVLGTPLYMAPERLRNPADADARADIYALAATAFYLLTARAVYQSESDHDLTYQVLNAPVPRVSAAATQTVPAQLDELIARCLAKDRAMRPNGMEEVMQVLDLLARSGPWDEHDAREWWKAHADAIRE